jgi:hypothetical protein
MTLRTAAFSEYRRCDGEHRRANTPDAFREDIFRIHETNKRWPQFRRRLAVLFFETGCFISRAFSR